MLEARKPRPVEPSQKRGWTFITHHAQVLLAVAQNPGLRVREIAEGAGITERYAYRVLSDLQNAGYVDRGRHGRCNVYRVHPDQTLGDPVVEEQSLRELLRLNYVRDSGELLAALAPRRHSASSVVERRGRSQPGSTATGLRSEA